MSDVATEDPTIGSVMASLTLRDLVSLEWESTTPPRRDQDRERESPAPGHRVYVPGPFTSVRVTVGGQAALRGPASRETILGAGVLVSGDSRAHDTGTSSLAEIAAALDAAYPVRR